MVEAKCISKNRDEKGLIFIELIRELSKIAPCGSRKIEVVTINGKSSLPEDARKNNEEDLDLYTAYVEFCNNNLKEVSVSLGFFEYIFNYEKCFKRLVEYYKNIEDIYEHIPNELRERKLIDTARTQCAAEMRDELKKLRDREEEVEYIINAYVRQLEMNFCYRVLEGNVVIYGFNRE